LKTAFRKLPEDAMADRNLAHKRILLKLSGEALAGDADIGIDPKVLSRLALEIGQLVGIGVQIGIVVGVGAICFVARRCKRPDSIAWQATTWACWLPS
jgi:uridylate kinase